MNAPWSMNKRAGTAVAARDAFCAFVCDEATVEILKPVVTDMGWQAEKIHKGGLRNAVQTLSVSASPQILMVDLTDCHDPLTDINALAEVCEPGTIVIALGEINDVGLYRDLLASGIHDYLLKPLHPEIVRDSLHNAQAALHGNKVAAQDEARPHVAVAVIGARGGVGTSTVASSIAWVCAEQLDRKTALLDLDIHFGVGALSFDLEPGRGLTDALENPGRIDSLFIERAIVKASEKLAILSAEAPINAPLLTDGAALHHLQDQLVQSFDAVIIDLPRLLAVQNPHLLTEISEVVVVTDLTLAAARDTIRLLSFLSMHAPAAKVRLIANKVPAQGQPEVARKDFEASVERAIDIMLPLDAKHAVAAAKQGKSLAQSATGTKVAAELAHLAQQVMASMSEDGGANEHSLLGKLKDLKSLLAIKK